MSSVTAPNPSLSNLLQTLSSASPQLSPLLSAPSVQTALAKAPPQDIVKFSQQALQLQQADLLFGSSIGTQSVAFGSNSDSLLSSLYSPGPDAASNSILQALESASASAVTSAASTAAGSASAQPASSTSAATQTATAAANSQAQQLAALLGGTPATGSGLNTLG